MTAFEELGILPEIAKAVDELEWKLPTDIQAEAIPLILGGGDVLMAAESDSGKTGAFCLPVLQIVYKTMYCQTKSKSNPDQSDDIKLSLSDRAPAVVLSADLLSCQSKTSNWAGVRSNKGCVTKDSKQSNKNKFYYEIHFTEAGPARFGWSLANANLDLGTDRDGFGYDGTAKKSNNGQFDNYGLEFGARNDVLGAMIDLDTGDISFTKNGEFLGPAFCLGKNLLNECIFMPTICTKNAKCSVRFKPLPNSKTKTPNGYRWIGECLNSRSQIVSNPNCEKSSSSTSSNKNNFGPKAIIIEPSRELAQQTLKCINGFKKHLPDPIEVQLILDGYPMEESSQIKKDGIDIIVATPHRLEELVNNGHISLNSCRFFIIDEIDALLAQGNLNVLCSLHGKMPKMFNDGSRLQLVFCSTTSYNFGAIKLSNESMYFNSKVDQKDENQFHTCIFIILLHDRITIAADKRVDDEDIAIKCHIIGDMVFGFSGTEQDILKFLNILQNSLMTWDETKRVDNAIDLCTNSEYNIEFFYGKYNTKIGIIGKYNNVKHQHKKIDITNKYLVSKGGKYHFDLVFRRVKGDDYKKDHVIKEAIRLGMLLTSIEHVKTVSHKFDLEEIKPI